ncbi:hypothetical protein R1sor_012200 [Riccia sorocarpa]|uniref:Uncharacterized protein n=1 Tax=Riccia sorocarpa TaxID=122646 RepID=A0ABD3I4Y5_9MARC
MACRSLWLNAPVGSPGAIGMTSNHRLLVSLSGSLPFEVEKATEYAINTFTKKPFRGNPAAVCYLPYERSDEWLKLIAKEFNLPATAFVIKRRQSKTSISAQSGGSPLIAADETGTDLKAVKRVNPPLGNEFDIRWFSTDAELLDDLAIGALWHATLASAHMLFSSGMVEGDTLMFHSKKGTLSSGVNDNV